MGIQLIKGEILPAENSFTLQRKKEKKTNFYVFKANFSHTQKKDTQIETKYFTAGKMIIKRRKELELDPNQ